jgi:replicative DNA helicase
VQKQQYVDSVLRQEILKGGVLAKQMPASPEAERAVLAALLLNDDVVVQVAEVVQDTDFYTNSHRYIYKAILDIAGESKRIDLITLQDELAKRKQLDLIGGVAYLLSLQEDIPALGLVQQHATIVKEKAVLRELINSASDIIERCYTQNDDSLEVVIDHAQKQIFHIADKRTTQGFVQLDIWLKKTFKHLSDIKSHSKGITGIPSGYKKLDEMSSGFQNGDLIVLAGRPSMGKTALALNFAVHAAKNNNVVGVFSLEMSAEQLTLRMLSSESDIAHHNIRNATITSQEWISLTNVAARLAQMKIFIDDTPMLDIMSLRAKARKLKREHGLSLLVVDYLQLLHSPRRHENRHQEVSEISRALKALAKELSIPVIAGSQLSRAVDSRMDKRPILSDLRESGAIEQDADLIMFLYREIVYNAEAENPSLAELIISKQRNGPTGTTYMNFIGEISLFADIDDEYK